MQALMKILELLRIIILILVCVIFSIEDAKDNHVDNKKIAIFGMLGIILSCIYYGTFFRDEIITFLANIGALTITAILLYATHIWAAGDSKFLILIGVLIPLEENSNTFGPLRGVMIPVIAFSIGLVFLVGDTLINLLRKEYVISKENFVARAKKALIQFIINSMYVLTLVKIEDFFLRKTGFQLGIYQVVFNVAVLILIGKFSFFHKKEVIGFVAGSSLLYSFGTGIWMISPLRFVYYIITFLYILFQIFLSDFNYKKIATCDVKKGMVLSFGTTMLMQYSKVQGLPGISHEDMRDRLDEGQAEAIRRWGKTKNGRDEIMIVRKIPFVFFLSCGIFLYCLLGRMAK